MRVSTVRVPSTIPSTLSGGVALISELVPSASGPRRGSACSACVLGKLGKLGSFFFLPTLILLLNLFLNLLLALLLVVVEGGVRSKVPKAGKIGTGFGFVGVETVDDNGLNPTRPPSFSL